MIAQVALILPAITMIIKGKKRYSNEIVESNLVLEGILVYMMVMISLMKGDKVT